VTRLALPNNWSPRPYQRRLWDYLSSGGKRAVAVWHRRAGKDDVCLHHTACAAMERPGNYWHLLPEYAQARKAVWEAVNPHTGKRRIDEAFPPEIRETTREQEMMIRFPNKSTWQLVGSDNFNALMGTPPIGVNFSEFALANPAAWAYIRPILLENGGWATFISTPRGKNHLKAMYDHAEKDPAWFRERLTADQTGVFTAEQLANELRELQAQHGDDFGRSIFEQEYLCSFEAAILGSIWGDLVAKADREGRITAVPHQEGIPVHTAWDLGFTDDTACWFFQMVFGEVHVIDYFQDSNKGVEHYAGLLKARQNEHGYQYGTHFLPHDARARTMAAGGKSIQQQLHAHKVGRIAIAPRLDVEEGIQAGRATFPAAWFDAERCAVGLEHLRNFKREWDDEKKVFSMKPVHDGASHAASAWRTLSLVWKRPALRPVETPLEERMLKASVQNQTWGQVRKSHFDRKRRERAETVH
jgi:phage terminase large subunit